MSDLEILSADLQDPAHAAGLLRVLDSYAREEVGGGAPLSDDVRARLVPALEREAGAHIVLALLAGEPVGVAVCFRGFSTFAARPILNLHDFAVLPAHRSRGIGRALLEAVERRARELGCCKLTLEVAEINSRARALYEAFGFESFGPAEAALPAWFLQKKLD